MLFHLPPLDKDRFRIRVVAIKIGLEVCVHHKCRGVAQMDKFGLHPLSYISSIGRFPQHSALNDAINRGLGSAGFPSQFDPGGLNRGDWKCTDSQTVLPCTLTS